MNPALGIWILLGIEAACIATIRWLVRRRGEFVRRHKVVCPVDGKPTHTYVFERQGVSEPADLLQCDRLNHGGVGCDRSCVRGKGPAQPLRPGSSGRN